MWKLHLHPLRGVTSGQSVCLRRYDDDWYQRVDAAQFPAGAPADPPGGETGASAEQRAHSVEVRHDRVGVNVHELVLRDSWLPEAD